ncbi:Molybdopterin-guanine dinucleotide biosynthesis protein MobA [Candidatus Accumulibacter phosphatis]|uniref:Molybdenum cofactor guanylyltransferase n=3 Tax=Candidatus Accumulibacter TaxID=327159 RepID=A0A080M155_9PROT|nr:MAG: Molybdenum cofactor guanylyltransferase [Candidatus Accumulibacter cognatus]TMQ75266.1 Molybdopterin-guanine dinucleotide biosynthesis protein MobA [Candidatus Accumulibacter phosphatis]HNG04756.1 molybdenum cofactor guanylyltransferase MobA [Nitrospira sp.]
MQNFFGCPLMRKDFPDETACITGVILAGGRGRRMGGVDKGLQELCGRPLVAWVIERFGPQVDELLINANQNGDRYAVFGHRVLADQISEFAGPLAGLQAALTAARHSLLATAPCDSPFLPSDLVHRLRQALTTSGADLAVARTFNQPQPVFCLCRREVLPSLSEYLESGGRRVDRWHAMLQVVEVAFDDQAGAFENINNRDELERFERAVPDQTS